jgi:putative flippase GtrA
MKNLIKFLKDESKSLFWFGIIGLISAIIYNTLLLFTLDFFLVDQVIGNSIAYVTAAMFSYYGHQNVTFKVKVNHKSQGIKFIAQAVLGYLISNIIIYVNELMGSATIIGGGIVTIAIPILNYFIMKLWTFKKGK